MALIAEDTLDRRGAVVEAARLFAAEIAEDERVDAECRGRCDSYAHDNVHVEGCPIPILNEALTALDAQEQAEQR